MSGSLRRFCCPADMEIRNGMCQFPICGERQDCRLTPIAGAAKCLSGTQQFYCCKTGKAVKGGICQSGATLKPLLEEATELLYENRCSDLTRCQENDTDSDSDSGYEMKEPDSQGTNTPCGSCSGYGMTCSDREPRVARAREVWEAEGESVWLHKCGQTLRVCRQSTVNPSNPQYDKCVFARYWDNSSAGPNNQHLGNEWEANQALLEALDIRYDDENNSVEEYDVVVSEYQWDEEDLDKEWVPAKPRKGGSGGIRPPDDDGLDSLPCAYQ